MTEQDINIRIGLETNEVKNRIADLKTEFNELKGKLGDNLLPEKEKNQILTRMGQIKSEVAELTEETRAKAEAFAGEVGKFAGGIGSVMGATSVLAASASEDTQKMIEEFVKYQAVIAGIQGATELWTSSQRILNVVMAKNPIGLIVAGLTAAVVVIGKLFIRTKELTKEQKELNEVQKQWNKTVGDGVKVTDDLKDEYESIIISIKSLQDEINILNGLYDKNSVSLRDATDELKEYEKQLDLKDMIDNTKTSIFDLYALLVGNRSINFKRDYVNVYTDVFKEIYNSADLEVLKERLETGLADIEGTDARLEAMKNIMESYFNEVTKRAELAQLKIDKIEAEQTQTLKEEIEKRKELQDKYAQNAKNILEKIESETRSIIEATTDINLELWKQLNVGNEETLEYKLKLLEKEKEIADSKFKYESKLREESLRQEGLAFVQEIELELTREDAIQKRLAAEIEAIDIREKAGEISAAEATAQLKLISADIKGRSDYLKQLNTIQDDFSDKFKTRMAGLEAAETKYTESSTELYNQRVKNAKGEFDNEDSRQDIETIQRRIEMIDMLIEAERKANDNRIPFTLFGTTDAQIDEEELIERKIKLVNDYYRELKNLAHGNNEELQNLEKERLAAEEALRDESIERWKAKQADGIEFTLDTMNSLYDSFAEGLANSNDHLIATMSNALNEYVDNAQNALDAQLDAGVLSQNEYDKRMEELDDERAAKEKEITIKEFEMSKRASLTQIAVDTATGIVKTIANLGMPAAIPSVAALGVISAAQAAVVSSQEPPVFEQGGMIYGPSHRSGGVHIEAEGGEYIINKRAMQIPAVEMIASFLNNVKPGQPQMVNVPTGGGMSDSQVDRIINGINDKKVVNVATETAAVNDTVVKTRNRAKY
jgi:hypothetical protein